MLRLLLALALLFGAYEGTCESLDATPAQLELAPDDLAFEVAPPVLPIVAVTTVRAQHRSTVHRQSPELARVFRPPRS